MPVRCAYYDAAGGNALGNHSMNDLAAPSTLQALCDMCELQKFLDKYFYIARTLKQNLSDMATSEAAGLLPARIALSQPELVSQILLALGLDIQSIGFCLRVNRLWYSEGEYSQAMHTSIRQQRHARKSSLKQAIGLQQSQNISGNAWQSRGGQRKLWW